MKKDTSSESELADYWFRLTGTAISAEDQREAVENICGFFNVLDEWDRQDSSMAEISVFGIDEAVQGDLMQGANDVGCLILKFPNISSFGMVTSGAA